ncbi:cell envelope integrity protein TolA [Pseudomonas syringae pv. aptata]|jgi:colicin import membrane protein|uniref:Cell division and transport-associated protein TolA n=10 Tax=Pseudomonas syringae group TaxID=136849 RepID=A0AAQ1L6Z4_PSESX|nr:MULTISPECIES: cell envelope integrity protein TolA [Pseudomonas]EGH28354.1 tolA protein [Pseudomonas syringae pv. japonica str. M301072]KEZ73302.1 cell envelope biogenesis protein TolA [Pseudomonas syringae pv. syringae FF5]ALU59656.1 protein TolA [Pseudomonas syringae pv. lapsa]AVX23988.1 cell envelope integrity protein TolA [Pseudomonas syringae pv. atrofaciens]AZG85664.1 cell envelope integrity protein TolA [Pseudomonas syringae pv. pisi str. PP1]
MQPIREPSASESYFWPSVWAVALHILIFGMLFVSFAMTPDLPEAKPIVQATLYQLKSKSQATTQTNQKIAGEAKKTAARQTEVEQLEQKKIEQQKQEAVKAAEQKKEESAQKAEEQKAADEAKKAEQKAEEAKKADDAKKADEAKKVADAKKLEDKQQADIAKKKAEEEAKKKAEEDAKKAAAEEAKKQAADEAKKKAAEDAKKKAAEDAKKKAAADSAKKAQEAARKSAEDKKAQALADLLSDKPERQQALADERGDETAGSFDDLIRVRASEGWSRPPSARNNMSVTLQIGMLPDGTIASVSIAKSSGDGPFDSSAVAAVKNIGRLTEMQGLKPADFAPYRSFKMTFTPGDLAL